MGKWLDVKEREESIMTLRIFKYARVMVPVLESFWDESERISEFHLCMSTLGKEWAEEEGTLSRWREQQIKGKEEKLQKAFCTQHC